MHHNLIIKDGDTTKVVKEVLVDGIQFVDEKPRAGSTNPVTSGGVLDAQNGAVNALSSTDHEGSTLEIPDPDNKYTVGKFTFGNGTFYYCSAKSDGVATLYEYSICEALNFLKGLIDDLGE